MHRTVSLLPVLYGSTLFVGALLLFSIQPMVGKLVLPVLGGAPAVWNSSLVFFQTMLLAGYFYAFVLSKLSRVRHQVMIHLGLLLLAFPFLPVSVPANWSTPTGNPIFWLIGLLMLSVGLPFFVVSTTAPLMQRWFSYTQHPDAADPYFLYAPSNFGGLVALLAYPTLIEPYLRLANQGWTWTGGFVLLVALIVVCAAFLPSEAVRRGQKQEAQQPHLDYIHPGPHRIVERARWLLLAFLPSSLLLGVTSFLTTDIAAIPLLWVVPLAIYLTTFVLVFARNPLLKHQYMVLSLPFLALPLIIWFFWRFEAPVGVLFALHLVAFFALAMVCHGELAASRPVSERLTEFYLFLSLGGVLGGAFNALAAPILFNDIYEYPLAIILVCLLVPASSKRQNLWVRTPFLLVNSMAVALLVYYLVAYEPEVGDLEVALALGAIALLALNLARGRFWFGIVVGGLVMAGFVHHDNPEELLSKERSYFGVYRVESDDGHYRLLHGTTIHGAQRVHPEITTEPLTYYGTDGPLGQVFGVLQRTPQERKIAVIGLGIGTIACFGRTQDQLTFYEIDPAVEQIARDTRYFTYLRDCPPKVNIVLGDARATLAGAPDHAFDLIVVDAFSSDAIPVHLVTKEAIQLYLSKLKGSGLLALHITNRHVKLEPVLEKLARELRLSALIRLDDRMTLDDEDSLKFESDWVAMSPGVGSLAELHADSEWHPLEKRVGTAVWTDDFSNVFSAIEWH